MITSIVRQSVIIKCNMQCAYLLGNYEFYYAAGLAAKLYELTLPDEIQPKELADALAHTLNSVQPNGEKEQYLVTILKDYIPEEQYDEQMKELLLMGESEQHLWQVSIS